ncbi:MAG: cell division protein FtsA [bacterium]
MKEELIAGIDFGNSKITCLVAKIPINTDKENALTGIEALEIIGDASIETSSLNNGLIIDLEGMALGMRTVVAEAEKKAGVKLNELFIGIGGSHIKGETVRGVIPISTPGKEITGKAVIEVKEQAKAIKSSPGREIVYTIPQKFIIDEQSGIKNPIGMTGNRLEAEIYIVSGSSMGVQNIYKSAERAKIGIRGLVLQTIANFYGVLEAEDRGLGYILVDIGEETTEVGIFSNGKIKEVFSIDVGGNYITNDIAIAFGISKREAEELKIKYGMARSEMTPDETINLANLLKTVVVGVPGGRNLANGQVKNIERKELVRVIAPRVEEIFGSINRKIKEITENNYNDYADFTPAGVIITGGTAKMSGIDGLAQRIFEMSARVGFPCNIKGLSDALKDPAYTSAVGLILYGLQNGEDFRDKTSRSKEKKMGKIEGANWFQKTGSKMRKWLVE